MMWLDVSNAGKEEKIVNAGLNALVGGYMK